ncbi:hypothetical protein MesoLj131b_73790 (plasmid) [Mesorhizobium sp. 131-2-5]|nr:hypothetical protein MesoLj131b_73790 [Mesorhizobium sp. 131-2-5]
MPDREPLAFGTQARPLELNYMLASRHWQVDTFVHEPSYRDEAKVLGTFAVKLPRSIGTVAAAAL